MGSSVVGRWWRPFQLVAEAAVFYVDLSPSAEHEAEAAAWLSAEEQARSSRYLHDGPRRRFVLSRAALRAVLCRRLGCVSERLTFGTSSYGKPFAEVDEIPHSIRFNVSHSANHGLIAVAPRGRIGVDIEERVARDDLTDLSSAVLGPNEEREFALLRGNRRTHFFFRIWTLKEALIKALGVGFSQDPVEFELPLALRHGARASTFRFPNQPRAVWRVDDLGTDDFAAALAHESFQDHGQTSVE